MRGKLCLYVLHLTKWLFVPSLPRADLGKIQCGHFQITFKNGLIPHTI